MEDQLEEEVFEDGIQDVEDDHGLLNSLLNLEEQSSGDTFELSDHNKLFESVNLDRTMKVFENAEKFSKSRSIAQGTTKKSGLINEDYLKTLIRDQVQDVFEGMMDALVDTIVNNMTYQVERAIASVLHQPETELPKTETNE